MWPGCAMTDAQVWPSPQWRTGALPVPFCGLHNAPATLTVAPCCAAGEVVAIFSAALLGIPECLNPVQVRALSPVIVGPWY